MGAGLAVGAAVADGELGSVMGSMLLNVHVPTTHTTSRHTDSDIAYTARNRTHVVKATANQKDSTDVL